MGRNRPRDVGGYLDRAAADFPDNTAVVDQGARLSNLELLHRANRVANALLSLGLKKGDRAAVLLNNCRQAVECFMGVIRAGLVLVPLNSRHSAAEHQTALDHSEAAVLILGSEFRGLVRPVVKGMGTLKQAICVSDSAPPNTVSYEELLAASSPEAPPVKVVEEDLISLRYTGGTTGPPKGVIHDHRGNLAIYENLLTNDFRIESRDSIALTGPVTHASGFMILPHLVNGAAVHLFPGFEPRALLQAVSRERITTLYLVPTMIVMLLAEPSFAEFDLSSLKTIRYGASPIAPAVLKRAVEAFGNVFAQAYGLTEAGMLLTLLTKEDHILDGSPRALEKLKSMGRPAPLVRVRVVDENGRDLPPRETGEIVVRTGQVMKGYWKNPRATEEVLVDGWLHTRDMGYEDEEGYIYLVDRKDDMIISGGFNIYPKEIEDVLYCHPAVLEAAVLGIPDPVWGEALKAVVVLKPGRTATEKEIVEHCRTHLAGYKKPRHVEFRKSLPKSLYGKVLRRQLRSS